MKTQSELKVYKSGNYEYIYVYYRLNNTLIRINTKNKYEKNFMQKDLYYKSNFPDRIALNERTQEIKLRVDDYIRTKLAEPFPEINQKECKEYIADKNYVKDLRNPKKFFRYVDYIGEPQPIEKSVLEYFTEFYQLKIKAVNHNRDSYKKYYTLQNALLKYQTTKGQKLDFKVMNDPNFIYDFRDFLLDDGKNDNTVNMRIKNLKTFFRYVEAKDIFKFNSGIYATSIPTFDNNVVALNNTEIGQLLKLEIGKPNWQKVIDVFVCNCYMGLRYSDLNTLDRGYFIQDDDKDWFYMKESLKTIADIEIPIVEPSLTILEKYDFKLPKFTNQHFNRILKDVLEAYDLFSESVKKNRKVNKKDHSISVPKRDLIRSHTMRRTFVTLALDSNVPLNSIMMATGHKKLSTLNAYVQPRQNKSEFKKMGRSFGESE